MKRTFAISALAVAVIACSEAPAEASSNIIYLECKGITSRPDRSDEVTVGVKRYKINLAKKRISAFFGEEEFEYEIDAEISGESIEVRHISTFEGQDIHSQISFDRYAGVVTDQSISSVLGAVTFTGECSRVDGPPVRRF